MRANPARQSVADANIRCLKSVSSGRASFTIVSPFIQMSSVPAVMSLASTKSRSRSRSSGVHPSVFLQMTTASRLSRVRPV